MSKEIEYLAIIERLVFAMQKASEEGCVDYLDASEDGGAYWYDALDEGLQAIGRA